jgi:hypothetical protein
MIARLFTTIADRIWAIPSGRSGLLRTEPKVSALREPAAIAIGVRGAPSVPTVCPTGEAGAPNLSTLLCLASAAFAASWFIAALVSGAGQ